MMIYMNKNFDGVITDFIDDNRTVYGTVRMYIMYI